jgi:hypothetical protein
MYRIGAVTACAAVLVCCTFGTASAVACDERVVGSCPIEPIVEAAASAAETATPLAYARAGKERGVRRARRASRYSRRAERRRPAKVVQVARTRQEVPPPRQETAEPAAAPAAITILPTVAAILPPTFVRDANVDGPKLEAGWNAVALAQATAGTGKPGSSRETSDQATKESPGLVQVADNSAEPAPPRAELMQASASAPPESAETPWLRFAVLAFGGLLAFGSAIRLFV